MGVRAEPAPASGEQPAASGQTGANARTAGTDPTPASSPGSEEQVARGPDLIREAFMQLRNRTTQTQAPQAPPASRDAGTEPERSGKPAEPKANGTAPTTLPAREQPAPANQSGQTNGGIVLTQEELDRRIQSETDRRLAKQRADEEARKQREEEQRLRREDPFEYVRLLESREKEQEEQQRKDRDAISLLEQQLNHYDRGILDPIVGALPETTRKKILGSITQDGIPGRQEIARQTLGALRSLWNAEGRETAKQVLMKDEKFIKEILARYGGQRADEGPPEIAAGLPPSSVSTPMTENAQVNGWMRSAGSTIRATSGRR